MVDERPTLRTLPPSQRSTLPGPPGLPFVREERFGDGHVWLGIVATEPGGVSPWHHHGAHATYVHVLEGEATLECGAGGRERLHATADGSLHVLPAGLPQREPNTGTRPDRLRVVRVGEGPALVQLDGPAG